MTDFNYKKYSLENLENWMHDAMSAGEATPQEIFDTIKKVVEENYYHHKHHASQAYELLTLINGHGKDYISSIIDPAGNDLSDVDGLYMTQSSLICDTDDSSDECKNAWNDFWDPQNSESKSITELSYEDAISKGWEMTADGFWTPPEKQTWIRQVELDGLSGECYITFPDELLEKVDWKEGDEIEWIDQGNGTFILRKVNVK